MRNHNDSAVDEIKEELFTLRDHLKEVLADSGEKLNDKARAVMEDTLEEFEDKIKALKNKTAKAYRSVDETVRENPWQTAGVALAVGIALGAFLSRSKE